MKGVLALLLTAWFGVSFAQSDDVLKEFAYFLYDSHKRTTDCAGFYSSMGKLMAKDASLNRESTEFLNQASTFMQFSALLESSIDRLGASKVQKMTEGRLRIFEGELRRTGFPSGEAITLLNEKYGIGCPVALKQIPRELEQWALRLKSK